MLMKGMSIISEGSFSDASRGTSPQWWTHAEIPGKGWRGNMTEQRESFYNEQQYVFV